MDFPPTGRELPLEGPRVLHIGELMQTGLARHRVEFLCPSGHPPETTPKQGCEAGGRAKVNCFTEHRETEL